MNRVDTRKLNLIKLHLKKCSPADNRVRSKESKYDCTSANFSVDLSASSI